MKRRNFLGILGGAAVWPAMARAQQSRNPKIGVVMISPESDSDGQRRAAALRQGLEALGLFPGRNLQLEFRWGAGSPEVARKHALDLVALAPDVIVANGTPAITELQRTATRIPIVFVVVTDPVGSGFVDSMARPGGNITGFSTFEPEMGAKWLQLLKEIAPEVRRIGCVLDPKFPAFAAIGRETESFGQQLGFRVTNLVFRERGDAIEAQIAQFAETPQGGLIVFPTAINNVERSRLFELAARHRLPAIYPFRHYATDGGLMAYGFDPPDLFRRSAGYVDRILKGAKLADLPVQAPTKFELAINMKVAKALDLSVPSTLLARADEVIE